MNTMTAPTAKLIRMGDGAYITVVMNGESLTLRKSESPKSFEEALEALKNKNWDLLYQAMRPVKSYVNKVEGVEVTKDGVLWNGKPLNSVLATRIMEFAMGGWPHEPLCKFLVKLMKNPSKRAVDELYTFLEYQNLPITDNGNFLAYKGLTSDWYSVTSGKATLLKGKDDGNGRIFNGVGEEIEIPRNEVDDDKEVGCSHGLHAGTLEYAKGFARGVLAIVEIDPTDVVSIPTDCSHQKLRTCRYKVVAEYDKPLDKPLYESKFQVDDKFPDTDSEDRDKYYDAAISFVTNESDWIERVDWYGDKELIITKRDGGTLHYQNVSEEDVCAWEAEYDSTGSAGKFYNRVIKPYYSEN